MRILPAMFALLLLLTLSFCVATCAVQPYASATTDQASMPPCHQSKQTPTKQSPPCSHQAGDSALASDTAKQTLGLVAIALPGAAVSVPALHQATRERQHDLRVMPPRSFSHPVPLRL